MRPRRATLGEFSSLDCESSATDNSFRRPSQTSHQPLLCSQLYRSHHHDQRGEEDCHLRKDEHWAGRRSDLWCVPPSSPPFASLTLLCRCRLPLPTRGGQDPLPVRSSSLPEVPELALQPDVVGVLHFFGEDSCLATRRRSGCSPGWRGSDSGLRLGPGSSTLIGSQSAISIF